MNVADVDKKNVFVSKNECYLLNLSRISFQNDLLLLKSKRITVFLVILTQIPAGLTRE